MSDTEAAVLRSDILTLIVSADEYGLNHDVRFRDVLFRSFSSWLRRLPDDEITAFAASFGTADGTSTARQRLHDFRKFYLLAPGSGTGKPQE